MEDEALEIIYDKTEKKRVIIFSKKTGTFYYEEEYFSEQLEEVCWIPKGRRVIGIYDSQMKALTEARANIKWFRSLKADFKNL